MNIPYELKYTKDHEWVRVEGGTATVGITDFAQSQLGDVVFVEVPSVGEVVARNEVFGTIEAVKTVSDLFNPLTGEIAEFNGTLEDIPDVINKDPYGEGWIIKIAIGNPAELDELLSAEQYKALIG